MNEPKTYRKKPVEIQAVPWTGTNINECIEFLGDSFAGWDWDGTTRLIAVHTLEGLILYAPGWYLINGVKNEKYGCNTDIFLQTYEEV